MNGIVIKSIDYKESSKIVYIYSKNGLNGYKLLSVKNKKNTSLGNFITGNVIEFSYTNASFPSIIDFHTIKSSMDLVNDINKLEVLRIMIEVINYIPQDSNNDLMYNFIEKSFIALSSNIDPYKVLDIFLIKMLYVFGINPILKCCAKCGSVSNFLSFSIVDGGILCMNCTTIKNDSYIYWQEYYYSKKEIEEYSDCNFIELLKEINKYYLINAHINLNIKIA